MTCKHCGAPIEKGMEKCPYCDTMTEYGEMMVDRNREQQEREAYNEKLNNLPRVKHVSTGMSLLLYVLTFGLYGGIWYAMRALSLNRLQSKVKLPMSVALIQAVACLTMWFVAAQGDDVSIPFGEKILQITTCTAFILSIWLAFRVRKILLCHTAAVAPERDKLEIYRKIAPSGILLFFVGPLYLQYTINKMFKMNLVNLAI